MWELRRTAGSDGSDPAHLRRTMGLPVSNSRVWDSRDRELASEIMNSAASWYRGLGWAVLIWRYFWKREMTVDESSCCAYVDCEEETSSSRRERWKVSSIFVNYSYATQCLGIPPFHFSTTERHFIPAEVALIRRATRQSSLVTK